MIQFRKRNGDEVIIDESRIVGVYKASSTSTTSREIKILLCTGGEPERMTLNGGEIDIDGVWRLLELAMSHGKNIYRDSTPEKGKAT